MKFILCILPVLLYVLVLRLKLLPLVFRLAPFLHEALVLPLQGLHFLLLLVDIFLEGPVGFDFFQKLCLTVKLFLQLVDLVLEGLVGFFLFFPDRVQCNFVLVRFFLPSLDLLPQLRLFSDDTGKRMIQ